jgi:hypothetical protein
LVNENILIFSAKVDAWNKWRGTSQLTPDLQMANSGEAALNGQTSMGRILTRLTSTGEAY